MLQYDIVMRLYQGWQPLSIVVNATKALGTSTFVFQVIKTLADLGQGSSAESRAPNWPFMGRPNFEIDIILGLFYLIYHPRPNIRGREISRARFL